MARFDSGRPRDIDYQRQIEEQRFPDFEKVIEENNRQLVEEIMPLYGQMVEHFAANMGLAKKSTLQYFGALVEFVEIWNRWLRDTLPPEALDFLGHSEDKLKPFYDDLYMNVESLRCELESVSISAGALREWLKRLEHFIQMNFGRKR